MHKTLTDMGLLAGTDKAYWHRYTEFYEPLFSPLGDSPRILEYGVLGGASIRLYLEYFKGTPVIHGVDILDRQPDWPTCGNVRYHKADQGRRTEIRRLLAEIGQRFNLVIEDGSHQPEHQLNCLVETVPYLDSGGLYILEDAHTGLPGHPLYKKTWRYRNTGTCFHLLQAIAHVRERGIDNAAIIEAFCKPPYTEYDLNLLLNVIGEIWIYRRSLLPLQCYKCKRDAYHFAELRCACGTQLWEPEDSISIAIRAK